MTDNKNIFTNNKKSDSQNVKDNLLIDELDTYSDYVHEFSDSYKNRKEEFLRSLESVNEHKATGKENTVIKNFNNNRKISSIRSIKRVFTRKYDRIAAAVILAMILIPCTVLAAEKIVSYYNINIKKTGNYSYDLGLRKDSDYNANTKFHTNVKINFNTDLSGYDIETDGSNYKLSYAGNDNLRASASIMFFNKIRYVQCSECCQETEIGRYPIEWTLSTLGDVLDTIIDRRGLTPTKLGSEWSNEGIIALSAKSVKNHELVNLDIANHVDNDLYNRWMPQKLQSQDILMTSEAPLGEFYYLADFSTYCLSQRLFAMRANKTIIEPTVLYFQLTDSIGKHQIDIRKTGTTVTGIRQSELIQVPIIVPPMNIQKEFARFCNPIMITIEKNADEIRQLFKLQEMLLSRLSR